MPSAHFKNVLNLFSSSVRVGRYGLRDAQQNTGILIADEFGGPPFAQRDADQDNGQLNGCKRCVRSLAPADEGEQNAEQNDADQIKCGS